MHSCQWMAIIYNDFFLFIRDESFRSWGRGSLCNVFRVGEKKPVKEWYTWTRENTTCSANVRRRLFRSLNVTGNLAIGEFTKPAKKTGSFLWNAHKSIEMKKKNNSSLMKIVTWLITLRLFSVAFLFLCGFFIYLFSSYSEEDGNCEMDYRKNLWAGKWAGLLRFFFHSFSLTRTLRLAKAYVWLNGLRTSERAGSRERANGDLLSEWIAHARSNILTSAARTQQTNANRPIHPPPRPPPFSSFSSLPPGHLHLHLSYLGREKERQREGNCKKKISTYIQR